jgi:hypothetical protein
MQHVKGAGINVITEILHSLDNLRFVVMNQASVAGLGRAVNVDPAIYVATSRTVLASNSLALLSKYASASSL